jgi:DNA-binding GntR family transcriptional regulator
MRVRVYRALARGLMAGMFKPGEAVTLRTLAKRLGTSAMPVREAVSRLIAEILEGMVAEAACARAAPALLRKLSDINDAMKTCLADGDVRGALSHNVAFHFTLYRAAGKPVVVPLIEMLWLQAGPFLALSLATPGMCWTAKHHQALLAALRANAGPLARRAIEADIADTSAQLLKNAIFEDAANVVTLDSQPALVSLQ